MSRYNPYKKFDGAEESNLGYKPQEQAKVPYKSTADYKPVNITAPKSTAAVPSVKTQAAPQSGIKAYDPSVNYMEQMQESIKRGNYSDAKIFENTRNQKIGGEGMPYTPTDIFNYNDPYGGQMDALYDKIAKYNDKEFTYDYESDPRYKAIKSQKENEAEKGFQNGYAKLSSQFDGDVPANMVGMLLNQKQQTIDSADGYIPQLWQMAQQMYQTEGNNLYNQYGLLSQRGGEDYARWADDRGFNVNGYENGYNRDINARDFAEGQRQFDTGTNQWQQSFDYGQQRDKVGDNQWQQQFDTGRDQWQQSFDYGKQRDAATDELNAKNMQMQLNDSIMNATVSLMNKGLDYETAHSLAQSLVGAQTAQIGAAGSAYVSGNSSAGGSAAAEPESDANPYMSGVSFPSGSSSGGSSSGGSSSGGSSSGGSSSGGSSSGKGKSSGAGTSPASGEKITSPVSDVKSIYVDGVGYMTPAEVERDGRIYSFIQDGVLHYVRG